MMISMAMWLSPCGCHLPFPWVPEVEALRDTMNGNPEGGRKKIQRKARGKSGETLGFDGEIFEGLWPWVIVMQNHWAF